MSMRGQCGKEAESLKKKQTAPIRSSGRKQTCSSPLFQYGAQQQLQGISCHIRGSSHELTVGTIMPWGEEVAAHKEDALDMVGSEFGIKSMNPWTQSALCQQSRLVVVVVVV
ncbi:unnamed protein product [Pleuronectes platessa]|uniref:Uncharacterized protein n=1 Tax=Pleuronectes platessa TaxID=8262 RepID=A0A9N7Z502_PLEPL|nr:unnamed protein product [Pleuronectes platessa]